MTVGCGVQMCQIRRTRTRQMKPTTCHPQNASSVTWACSPLRRECLPSCSSLVPMAAWAKILDMIKGMIRFAFFLSTPVSPVFYMWNAEVYLFLAPACVDFTKHQGVQANEFDLGLITEHATSPSPSHNMRHERSLGDLHAQTNNHGLSKPSMQ